MEVLSQSCKTLLGDGFFEALDSNKLIRIPVHCQLWKFVDSNQNIEAEICWNFCSIGYKRCIALWTRIGSAVSYDFIKEFIVDEKIEEIFGRRIIPKISGWAMANRELFYIDSTQCIWPLKWIWWCIVGICVTSSFFIAAFAAFFIAIISENLNIGITNAFLRFLVDESVNLFIHIAK